MAEVRLDIEEWQEIQEHIKRIEDENRLQVYRGNSISYIYDKMTCYEDQVGMAFDALRELGFRPAEARDNDHMRELLVEFVARVKGEGE